MELCWNPLITLFIVPKRVMPTLTLHEKERKGNTSIPMILSIEQFELFINKVLVEVGVNF